MLEKLFCTTRLPFERIPRLAHLVSLDAHENGPTAAALESALSRFNSAIKAFRTFNCDYFLHALELVAVRTADVLEKKL